MRLCSKNSQSRKAFEKSKVFYNNFKTWKLEMLALSSKFNEENREVFGLETSNVKQVSFSLQFHEILHPLQSALDFQGRYCKALSKGPETFWKVTRGLDFR